MGEVRNTITGSVIVGVVVQGEHVTLQLPAQITPAMAGLPAASPSFTGRADDVEKVLRVLAPHTPPRPDGGAGDGAAGGAVLVTAVGGMGGIGKTELAVQAARKALDRGWFGGGVLFVDMFGYDPGRRLDAGRAVAGFLRAMAVPNEHVPADEQEQLVLYRSLLEGYATAGRPVLVFVDNVADPAQVLPLLPAHPSCRALVTSRERLAHLDARLIDLDALRAGEAVALLQAALHTRLPDDRRLTDRPEAAEQLAALCGGLPLALRIVAALLAENTSLTPKAITKALRPPEQRLAEMRDGAVTITTVFEMSYRRLTGELQRLFRLLPINPGADISTPAAAALMGWDHTTTRRSLTDLARTHLIEPVKPDPDDIEPDPDDQRWRMHDLLRLYAQHLTHAGTDANDPHDGDHALNRLLDHYEATAERACAHLQRPSMADPSSAEFPDRDSALRWLDTELDNLTATITSTPATNRHREHTRDLPLPLADYLAWRRHFNLQITLTTAALHQAEHFGDLYAEGMALNNLGIALQEVRRFEEAITAHQQDLEICRETGDRHREGTALNNLGNALQEVRRFEEAITAHTHAAAIYRETGDRHGEGIALGNLGIALREVRRFEEAITAHQQDLEICRETGDRHREGTALNNLGNALQEVRRFEEAITAHTHAAAIYRETGDRHGEGIALGNLGIALREVRRFEEAITAHTHAAAIYRETGDRHGEGIALGNLGIALRRVGRFEEAITTLTHAAAIFRETGDRHGEGIALDNLGIAEQSRGRFVNAFKTIFRRSW